MVTMELMNAMALYGQQTDLRAARVCVSLREKEDVGV